jgi:carbon monoxide dehydrogenase subunit G
VKLSGSHTFNAPLERVWSFLIDPEKLAKCIPGVKSLETVGEHEYAGEIDVGVAAVKGLYKGKVKLEDLRPPAHYRMVVDGKGKQGFVKGTGTLDLEREGPVTILKYAGDAQIGGPLASVGQRMIEGVAKTMTAQFFTAMEAEIAAAPGEVVRQGVAINFWRLFLKWLRGLFGRSGG